MKDVLKLSEKKTWFACGIVSICYETLEVRHTDNDGVCNTHLGGQIFKGWRYKEIECLQRAIEEMIYNHKLLSDGMIEEIMKEDEEI